MRRFSIATLMAVVLVCGVAVAALRDASDTWAGILLGLTLLMLGIAMIGVLHRRGTRRAFWQGFALFGWCYLALTTGPWASEQVGPRLPTTQLLRYAHARANPNQPQVGASQMVVWLAAGNTQPNAVTSWQPQGYPLKAVSGNITATTGSASGPAQGFFLIGQTNLDQFVRVGHCLFALLAALAGGLIARWFQRTDRVEIAA
jgi:hypothetical protein